MNNLILFATYWNEIDWIRPSLAQIDRLDPAEVIICDGCFDLEYPSPSTDGTREVIQEYVASRENARMISPVRCASLEGAYRLWKGHSHLSPWRRYFPTRLRRTTASLKQHHYRVNQALTFNYMITLSRHWKSGRWFMTYDCDQFYQDDTIERIKQIVDAETEYGLLTADEITFFDGFNQYTDEYETRKYNNMPHKIYSNTIIYPVRAVMLEGVFRSDYYINLAPSKHVGTYHHYKFRSAERFKQGYQVGDRTAPEIAQYDMKSYEGNYPAVIRDHISSPVT